jgi:hypothetical protein
MAISSDFTHVDDVSDLVIAWEGSGSAPARAFGFTSTPPPLAPAESRWGGTASSPKYGSCALRCHRFNITMRGVLLTMHKKVKQLTRRESDFNYFAGLPIEFGSTTFVFLLLRYERIGKGSIEKWKKECVKIVA